MRLLLKKKKKQKQKKTVLFMLFWHPINNIMHKTLCHMRKLLIYISIMCVL